MDGTLLLRCVSCLLVCYVTIATDPSLVIQPDDQRVVLQYGVSPIFVYLDCKASDYDGQSMQVSWFKNDVIISTNYVFMQDVNELVDISRYSISGGLPGRYRLQFHTHDDYVTFDTGQYYCALLYSSNKTVIDKSRTADINIHTSPLCVVDYGTSLYYGNAEGDVGNVDVMEGDIVGLTCRCKYTETFVPEDIMVWNSDDVITNLTLDSITETDGLLLRGADLCPKREEQGLTFTCTHRIPNKPDRTCQVGPFNIKYAPTVNVIANQMEIYTSQRVTLLCNSTGNPIVHGYAWTWDNEVITSNDNFHFEDNRTILAIQGLTVENNGPHDITCTGINEVGNTTSNTVTIQVNIQYTSLPIYAVTNYAKSATMNTDGDCVTVLSVVLLVPQLVAYWQWSLS
ncbi:cell adhesion molecule 2-like [Saccoglossus kowalevskii]